MPKMKNGHHKISCPDQISQKAGPSSWGVKIWTLESLSFEFHENKKTGFEKIHFKKIQFSGEFFSKMK